MKTIYILLFIIIFFKFQVFPQDKPFSCKTVEMNKLAEEKDPKVKQRREALAEFTKNYMKSKNKSNDIYVIPVVFHIVHDFGAENISKAQIEDAIRILNNDYRKLNADSNLVIPEFQSIAADSRIEFRLARIDPNGNCTEGITRTHSPLTIGAGENVKEVALSWPRAMYLNIWVVRSISGSAAAYAYYPGSAGDGRDGILCTHTYVGSMGTGSSGTSRVLTHEIGHYLNLPHPWGNSNNPGLSENCNIDDGIYDTPNTIGHTSCNVYAQTCGSLDNVQNYMEYSYCCKMFTMGQKDVMRAALNSSASDRNNLWTDNNRLATGTNDGFIVQECQPIADFYYQVDAVCVGTYVQFNDLSYNSDTIDSWDWLFPGGIPSSSTDQNPIVYYNNSGTYDVSLTTSNFAGNDTKSISSLITVTNYLLGENAPLFEGFENINFPLDTSDNNKSWEIVSDANYQWQRSTWTSASGNACLRIPNYLNDEGDISTLISPIIKLDSLDSIQYLHFKHAFARKSTSSSDKLTVSVSDDCGANWHVRFSKSDYMLSTTFQGEIYTSAFTPDSSEWKENVVNLGSYVNSGHIRLKFECTSGNGNWLYLDNIQLGDTANNSSGMVDVDFILMNFNVFPNPFNNELYFTYNLTKKSNVTLSINNILGEIVYQDIFEQKRGDHIIDLSEKIEKFENGMYFINFVIDDNDIKISRKVICIE